MKKISNSALLIALGAFALSPSVRAGSTACGWNHDKDSKKNPKAPYSLICNQSDNRTDYGPCDRAGPDCPRQRRDYQQKLENWNELAREELEKTEDDAKKKRLAEERKENGGDLSDHVYDGQRKISKTENLKKAAELANQGAQLVGSNAVNVIGQAATSRLTPNSKFSETLKASKKATKTAQWASQVTGAANAVFAYSQHKRMGVHKQNLAELKGCSATETSVSCGNDAYLAEQIQNGAKAAGMEDDVSGYLRQIKLEQNRAVSTAQQGRMTSLLLAAQQAANATMTGIAAGQQQKNINDAKTGETLQTQIGTAPGSLITMNGTMGVEQQAATAQPTGDPTTAENDGTGDAPVVDLGGPSNPFGGEDAPQGPMAGQFKAGQGGPTGGSAGGGAPNVGGGGAPPSGGGEEQKAQYVANFEGRDRYESAGSAMKAGGGAGKGGAAGAGGDGGLDFNSLLAQFLPKGDSGDSANDQGILEYGAGRAPAAEAPAASYLDKSADIFQRIHQTYQEKQGRGHVGI